MNDSTLGRGLYVHVPFCKSRCDFCPFYLEIYEPAASAAFVRALLQEISLYRDLNPFGDQPLTSVYFGGGTPTTLSTRQLILILAIIRDAFVLDQQPEISIEAHPGTVTRSMLNDLVKAGFNRISLGAESMDRGELLTVGRPGSPKGTALAVHAARQAGFSNIGLDLMYGLPGQTMASWLRTLEHAVALGPTHLSCYALTMEEGTHLEEAVRRGTISAPDPELQNHMEELAEERLTATGFRRYEISNYALDGFQCRHNLLYWTAGFYIGLGPSAQSYVGDVRYGNVSNLDQYISMLGAGMVPQENVEHLSPRQRRREAAVFGLRKATGIPADLLFHDESPERAMTVHRLIEERYLERAGEAVRLTPHGRRYADEVSIQLL
ncbi:MAG TPA: radical SAM family heme chaperone HemW [Nitrospiraceae bacterium]|nr:radical SAM family heme chaperone HemW [Nitrospiraceae bacterium]